MSARNRPLLIFVLLVLLVVGLSVTSIYFYKRSHRLSLSSTEGSQEEVAKVVKEVEKLMVLPENETPTVATVSDPEKLKGQEFFIGAKKGDRVLIYSNAKKAILYDPVAKKIVNIAPITTGAAPNP